MKILLVNKFYYLSGGVERYVLEWEKILRSKGHEVIIFSMKDPQNNESAYSQYFIENKNFSSNTSIGKNLRTAFNSVYSVEAKKKLEQLIDDTRPDIAHIHAFCYQLTPSILFSLKKANIPVILTSHEYKPICPNQRLYNLYRMKICEDCQGKNFYNAVINKCIKNSFSASLIGCIESYFSTYSDIYNKFIDIIVTPSLFMKNKFLTHAVKKDGRIVHIPNFINVKEFEPNFTYTGMDFAYCGRVDNNKGIGTLARAAKKIKDGRLVIIGEGEWKPEIEGIIKREKIENIKMMGYTKGRELFNVISRCLFTVLPSEWYENGPFAILESMAMGRPVIGADIGGIPELIDDGVNGILFEPHNIDDLAAKIQYLLTNRDMLLKMGRMARQKVEDQYSSESHYERLMEIYKQAIMRGRRN